MRKGESGTPGTASGDAARCLRHRAQYRGGQEPERYERWQELYRTYMPTIIALAEAGWEP